MAGINDGLDVEEIGEPEIRRSMIAIHLDAVAGEFARATQLPATDPAKQERLYELSRRQKALLEAQKPGAKA